MPGASERAADRELGRRMRLGSKRQAIALGAELVLLKRIVAGIAIIVLGSLLIASLGLTTLAIAVIAVDLSAPTDFGIGRAMGTIGLIIWTPVAVAAAIALRWVWRRRNREWRVTRRQLVATGVPLGALVVIAGSVGVWGTCPDTSCGGGGGELVLIARSGLSWGPGLFTLGLGLALLAAFVDVLRSGGSSRARGLALGASVASIGVAALWALRMFVFDDLGLHGPGVGVYFVVVGALVAAIASPSLGEDRAST